MIGEWNNGTGRRKSSVARVFIKKGTGKITVNDKDIQVFFGRQTSIMICRPTSRRLTSWSTSTAAVSPARPAQCATASPVR